LLAGIAGACGVLSDDVVGIRKLLQISIVLLFGVSVIIAWYLAKVVYEVSLVRLFLAFFVGGLVGSLVTGVVLGAMLAG